MKHFSDEFFPSLHPQLIWLMVKITSLPVALLFLLPPQEVTLKSQGHPLREKHRSIKKASHFQKSHLFTLKTCSGCTAKKKKNHLVSTLCHSYIKLEHEAQHLSSLSGLYSERADNH